MVGFLAEVAVNSVRIAAGMPQMVTQRAQAPLHARNSIARLEGAIADAELVCRHRIAVEHEAQLGLPAGDWNLNSTGGVSRAALNRGASGDNFVIEMLDPS